MAKGGEHDVSIVVKARDEASNTLGHLGENLVSLQGICVQVAAALAAIGYTYSKVAAAAGGQQTAQLKLAVALRSVGDNTETSRKRFIALATDIQTATGANDEMVLSVISLLAQVGHLSGDALEEATRAVMDYSETVGVEATQAALAFSNVLVKGVGRLKGINMEFDEGTSNAERFASVLRQVQSSMGGTAAAMGTSYEKALERLGNEWDDVAEAAGTALIQNEAFRGMLQGLSTVLRGVTRWVENHSAAMTVMAETAGRVGLMLIKVAAQIVSYQAEVAAANLLVLEHWVALASLAAVAPALFQKVFGVGGETAGEMALAAQKAIHTLAAVREGFNDLKSGGDSASAAIQSIIDSLGKAGSTGGIDPAGALGKGTESVAAFKSIMERLNDQLKTLGIPTMKEMETTILGVDNALLLLQNAEGLDPAKFDAILAAITEITRQLPEWRDDLSLAGESAGGTLQILTDMEETLQYGLTNAADQLGSALIDGAMGAKIAWGQFFRAMLADLLKAIFRAFVLDKIFKALGAAFGGPAGAAAGSQFGSIAISSGLMGDSATRAIGGSAVAMDPGLAVAANAGLSTERVGGSALNAAGGILMPITITPKRDRVADAMDLLEEIRQLVERRGYDLPATRLVG